MFKRINKKVLLSIVTLLIVSFSLTSVVSAADPFKNIRAWFGEIKIFRNGTQVPLTPQPFIIDGTTYVPLRAMSNLFQKDIYWDGDNYRIDINDRVGQVTQEDFNYAMQVINEKQNEIESLKAKVEELEKKTGSKKGSSSDLYDLEDYLNKEYDRYEGIDFEIELSEKQGDITVIIDMYDRYYDWDDLSTTKQKKFIKGIVDDIQYDYKKAYIEGYIEDYYTGDEVAYFYLDSKDNLVIEYDSYSGSYSLKEMEKYLNNNYDYDKSKDVDYTYKLYGDRDDIEIEIDAYYFSDLTTKQQKSHLEDVCKAILRRFPDAYIYGDVYDGKTWYLDFDYYRDTLHID